MFWFSAMAAPTPAPVGDHAQTVHLRALSMEELEVEAALARPLEAPIDVAQGPARLHLEGGWVVPVMSGHFAGDWERRGAELLARRLAGEEDLPVPGPEERGDREVVGLVWVAGERGRGKLEVDLPDRADALRLANRMVGLFGEPKEAWAPIAHEEAPLVVGVTDALLLSVDPQLDRYLLGPTVTDPYEVVIWGDRGEARRAGERARQQFAERAGVWKAGGVPWGSRLAWDRVGVEFGLHDAASGWFVGEVLTDRRFGLVVDPATPVPDPSSDRWLTVAAHPDGVDGRRQVRVSAVGVTPGGAAVDRVMSGAVAAPGPGPWSAGEAKGRVLFQPEATGTTVQVQVSVNLALTAVGRAREWFDLVIPRVDAVPGSWAVTAVELLDGTSLVGRRVGAPPPRGDDRDTGDDDDDDTDQLPEEEEVEESPTQRLVLPTAVPAGQQVVVRVKYVDTWPVSSLQEARLSGVVYPLASGVTSGLRPVLPSLSPAPVGAPWNHVLTTGVPTGSKLVTAVAGAQQKTWDDRGWTLTETVCDTGSCRWPEVAVGRFQVKDDPAAKGFPAIRVRLLSSHYGAIDQLAPEARRVIGYYQGWLPPFPVRELEVFEGPASFQGFTWIAPHGLVSLTTAKTVGSMQSGSYWNPRWNAPHLESGVYAHEIAHQYFGHVAVPATREDFWVAESFAELFSCMYVGAAFDPADCATRMDHARQQWEVATGRPALGEGSLSQAYDSERQPDLVYRYGPYVLGELLRPRLGTEAFFGALDAGLREHPGQVVTSEQVQGWFEASSGKDLESFFDYWVHGGFVPSVALGWRQVGGTVQGTVTADVPFGTFDVPVVVTVGGAPLAPVWVTVVDGSGAFEVPATGDVQVALDPDHRILARSRKVHRD
jgi:hypothetical protein